MALAGIGAPVVLSKTQWAAVRMIVGAITEPVHATKVELLVDAWMYTE
jgi:hypothetical protein